jgi:hypothetical protein
MSEFDELLKSLQDTQAEAEELVKALPTDKDGDDDKVEAAADEGDDSDESDKDEAAGEPEDKEPLAKSLVIDGEEYHAVDATDLIKSLSERMGSTEQVLAKALEITVATVKSQSVMLKSLSDKIDAFGRSGAGRKTVLTVLEKPAVQGNVETLAKSQQPEGISTDDFFMKANSLFDNKKISGSELNVIAVSLREKHAIDPKLISKVLNTNV